jgi:hypothetical protein
MPPNIFREIVHGESIIGHEQQDGAARQKKGPLWRAFHTPGFAAGQLRGLNLPEKYRG